MESPILHTVLPLTRMARYSPTTTTTACALCRYIVKQCKGQDLGKRPMLCSGSTMGTRDGILAYIDEMVKEFDAWLAVEKCRFDIIGDDQSIHDYL